MITSVLKAFEQLVPENAPGKPRYRPQNQRRVLCVFPKYSPSFGTFNNAYPLRSSVKAFMPLQGILVVAAYLPQEWEVRFVDENIRSAKPADDRWADAVIVSGMHIQRSLCIIGAPVDRSEPMTNANKPLEPSFEQALAKLALLIEQGFKQQNQRLDQGFGQQNQKLDSLTEKLEILTDQVGHFTEGLTELKVLVQEQSETAKQQAVIAQQQADTVKSLADSVASLLAVAHQK